MMTFFTLSGKRSPCFLQQIRKKGYDAVAKHAIAVEANTGKILYEKDATTSTGIGSITKLLTAYMVYKAVDQGDSSGTAKLTFLTTPLN